MIDDRYRDPPPAKDDAPSARSGSRTLPALLSALLLAACAEGGGFPSGVVPDPVGTMSPGVPVPNVERSPDAAPTTARPATAASTTVDAAPSDAPSGSVFGPISPPAAESAAYYAADGYAAADVLRVDVAIRETGSGPCAADATDGCTFADVLGDVDGADAFVAEVPVRFAAADRPADGDDANAEIRQRGDTTRTAPQKSFRVRLDGEAGLWRGERRLQLNKHPFDRSRLRNKLAFDLMQRVPHLPSLRTQFVHLWIDAGAGPVDQGLYTHVEAVTKEYLVNRGRDEDEPLYKAERFQFLPSELDGLALDAAGAPRDEARFEERLEIKRGDDHRALLRAAADVADPGIAFERTLERHFDADNALAWITTNLLLGQHDVGSHNYYLHDPRDTEALYFLPWDYDGAFRTEPALVDSFEPDALRTRLAHGFARLHDNRFTRRWLERPGAHDTLVAAATELRRDALSGDAIDALVAAYAPQIRPIVARAPDIGFVAGVREPSNMAVWDAEVASLAGVVETNFRTLVDGPHVPLPPFLKAPIRRGDATVLSWEPAFAVSGGPLVYDLSVASRADFAPGSVVLSVNDVTDAPGRVEYAATSAELPAGNWYLRVVARVAGGDPAYWQIANNVHEDDGVDRIGVRAFAIAP